MSKNNYEFWKNEKNRVLEIFKSLSSLSVLEEKITKVKLEKNDRK